MIANNGSVLGRISVTRLLLLNIEKVDWLSNNTHSLGMLYDCVISDCVIIYPLCRKEKFEFEIVLEVVVVLDVLSLEILCSTAVLLCPDLYGKFLFVFL